MMAFRWGIVSVNGRSRRKFISSPVNPAEIKELNEGKKLKLPYKASVISRQKETAIVNGRSELSLIASKKSEFF